ncbi:methyl-accepting chemotaxis protein [Thalassospira lucentensis]|uniref:methyl-accepting chemotaxis protein n=1 Tax=Thalassospira lucentensis TaxID=168935 RepID=UPI00142E5654|nr:HAMP domain-containing methyl-accepting chemotaxis protein [Thalassospira lucentensis]NIZ02803.1 HAMP domain-containing protein [Thalassospira lucentensis]
MKFLSRMRLIYQISLIGLAALTIFVVVAGVLFVADAQRQSAEEAAESALQDRLLVDSIAKEFLNARRREKDFLLRLEEQFAEDHAETVEDVRSGLQKLADAPTMAQFDAEIDAIMNSFGAYADKFVAIANLQREIGLSEKDGLLGSLRASVHNVEEELSKFNADKLTIIMLMMRRHEKDFLARIDPKYVDRIDARLAEFGPQLAVTPQIPSAEKQKITELMNAYVRDFKALAERILLKQQELVLLSDYYAAAEPVLDQLGDEITAIEQTSKAQAAEIAKRSLMITVIMFVVGAIALIAMSWILARTISGAIAGLTNKMGRLAENDFDVDINEVERSDEIGTMGRAVLIFRENGIERQKLEAIQKAEDEKRRVRLETQERYIREFDTAVVSVMAEVGTAVQQLHSASNVLRSSAETASNQSMVVSAGTEEASSNVQLVATAATELSASINEISSQVTETSSMAQSATERARNTNENIQGLNDAALKIGEVIGLISDIAGQTNLLALNATIEAARAGDAGKGFAVVASEVKNLANQTGKATEDITNQINGIQQATGLAVEAIDEIVRMISDISERAAAVAAAVEEQTVATSEISQNVEQAAAGTEEISAAMQGVSGAVADTNVAANDVHGSATNLGTQSESLQGQISGFLERMRSL